MRLKMFEGIFVSRQKGKHLKGSNSGQGLAVCEGRNKSLSAFCGNLAKAKKTNFGACEASSAVPFY